MKVASKPSLIKGRGSLPSYTSPSNSPASRLPHGMPRDCRLLLILATSATAADRDDSYKYHADGSLIWPHGVVSHLADTNQHYLVCKCWRAGRTRRPPTRGKNRSRRCPTDAACRCVPSQPLATAAGACA